MHQKKINKGLVKMKEQFIQLTHATASRKSKRMKELEIDKINTLARKRELASERASETEH